MDSILALVAKVFITLIQSLPLNLVARLGRLGGGLFYFLDKRHRTVATNNIARAFPEKSIREARDIALENFKRIGENFMSAAKTASMSKKAITQILTVEGTERFVLREEPDRSESRVFAIGHFGNFELYAHSFLFIPVYRFATTYRGIPNKALDDLLQSLRKKSGCLFFERRTQADELRQVMAKGGMLLGLLADQHAGDKGLILPFFGQECSTSPAPALFALRYKCPLFTSFCYRTGLGKWKIEVGDDIPTMENGQLRSVEEIMRDVNRSIETAIRRDPANWFWVHNRWKYSRRKEAAEAKEVAGKNG